MPTTNLNFSMLYIETVTMCCIRALLQNTIITGISEKPHSFKIIGLYILVFPFECKQLCFQREIHEPRQLSVMSENLIQDMGWHYIPEQLCSGTGFSGPHTLMWYCTPVNEGFVTQLPLLFLRGDRSMRAPLWSHTCNICFVFSLRTGWCQHTQAHTRVARQLTMHSWGHILHANGVSSSNE